MINRGNTKGDALVGALLNLRRPVSKRVRVNSNLHQGRVNCLPRRAVIRESFPTSIRRVILSNYRDHYKLHPFCDQRRGRLTRSTVRGVRVKSLTGYYCQRLSNNRRRHILLTHTLYTAQGVLLLSRPISNLSPGIAARVCRLVRGLGRRRNVAILVVSRSVRTTIYCTDRVLRINRAVFFNAQRTCLRDPRKQLFTTKGNNTM